MDIISCQLLLSFGILGSPCTLSARSTGTEYYHEDTELRAKDSNGLISWTTHLPSHILNLVMPLHEPDTFSYSKHP